MNVIVTDPKGYIGTPLVPMLQSAGHKVRGIDSDLFRNRTFGTPPDPVEGVIEDARDVEKSDLEGADAIVHLAALSNDAVVDLRPGSPTFLRWHGVELTQDNHLALYVPEGCATGCLTLADDSEIHYHTRAPYHPASAAGERYDDPAFGIAWPAEAVVLPTEDRSWPDYGPSKGCEP